MSVSGPSDDREVPAVSDTARKLLVGYLSPPLSLPSPPPGSSHLTSPLCTRAVRDQLKNPNNQFRYGDLSKDFLFMTMILIVQNSLTWERTARQFTCRPWTKQVSGGRVAEIPELSTVW